MFHSFIYSCIMKIGFNFIIDFMKQTLNLKFEKAVRMLSDNLPISDSNSRKPILFHDIRVGCYLYEKGYEEEIVIAGLLHDAIEWSNLKEDKLRKEFGDKLVNIILACSKNDEIKDRKEKIEDMIKRCVALGEEALIVKTADIIDSFKWYLKMENEGEIEYCKINARAILKFKPEGFRDEIFEELKLINSCLA